MKRINAILMVAVVSVFTMALAGCQKDELPKGALPGLFSVSANQQVRFSKGNMQYNETAHIWRFAEHQYDYLGKANDIEDISYSGWTDFLEYWKNINWPISNGGGKDYRWRMLTADEWDYLLNTRPNATSYVGIGNINGVGGLILLPDSMMLPPGFTFVAGFASDDEGWTRNNYTLAEWAILEAAGAVFLPAAGDKVGTYLNGIGTQGAYWTSTCELSVRLQEPYIAHYLYFYSGSASVDRALVYTVRSSVRAVLDN
ncbi:MAG: hypothetical protein IKN11_05720 [Bacteroidales bacterium]|nr:hypothetical protein [Bacteroidales bacterium]